MTSQQTRQAALQRQLQRVGKQIAHLQRQSDRLSNVRLLLVAAGVPTVSVLFFLPALRPVFWAALVIFLVAFGGAIAVHRRVQNSMSAFITWQTIKQTHLDRMSLEWHAIPEVPHHRLTTHPLAVDLDLYRLHRLVNTAVSVEGSRRLERWLVADAPSVDETHKRQTLVRELTGQPLFRDKLTLRALIAAQEIRTGGEGLSLVEWLQSPAVKLRGLLLGLAALSAVNITLFITSVFVDLPSVLLTLTLGTYALVFVSQFRRIQDTFEDALTIEGALRRLDAVMRYLERDRYHAMPSVRALVAPVLEHQPSKALRRATGVISGASLRANPIFWLLVNAVIPWDYFFALQLENLKGELRDYLPQWLDTWHEVEALCSLATFAYLNPAYTFPNIAEGQDEVFSTTQAGHPLIHTDERVRNDFAFSQIGDMVIVTGSNMAGKSSFLRTLGVNLCLAYAGGAVCADELRTDVFRLYTSIRVTDSLDDGMSYFYAEVQRLKGLLNAIDMPEEQPVFFLIDEIFRGTNNRERLIGSRSYIRALVGSNSVGLIATHDLDLVALADESPRIRNFHFREEVENGRMAFDYILRGGPSPTTNALRIMAMEGLPVEDAPEA